MFYNSTAVQALQDRVGWAAPVAPSDFALSAENAESTSGRFFKDFHGLAIVEYVIATMPNYDATDATKNAYLLDKKRSAVQSVLSDVFDQNDRAYYYMDTYGNRIDVSGVDFSNIILNVRTSLFDNAIGYRMALDVLELISTSNRSNFDERMAAAYDQVQNAMEGYTDGNGKTISRGVRGLYRDAIETVIEILFPKEAGRSPRVWNASYKW